MLDDKGYSVSPAVNHQEAMYLFEQEEVAIKLNEVLRIHYDEKKPQTLEEVQSLMTLFMNALVSALGTQLYAMSKMGANIDAAMIDELFLQAKINYLRAFEEMNAEPGQ